MSGSSDVGVLETRNQRIFPADLLLIHAWKWCKRCIILIHAWKLYENNMNIVKKKLFIWLHQGPLIYPPLMGCWTPVSTWSRWWRLSSLSAPTTNGGFVWTSLLFAEKPHFEPNPPVSSQWLKTPSFTCKLGHWLLSIFTAERLSWHTGNINWELFQTANLRVPKFAYLGWNSTRLREQGLIDWQTHDMKTSNPKVTKTCNQSHKSNLDPSILSNQNGLSGVPTGFSTTVGCCPSSNVLQIVPSPNEASEYYKLQSPAKHRPHKHAHPTSVCAETWSTASNKFLIRTLVSPSWKEDSKNNLRWKIFQTNCYSLPQGSIKQVYCLGVSEMNVEVKISWVPWFWLGEHERNFVTQLLEGLLCNLFARRAPTNSRDI